MCAATLSLISKIWLFDLVAPPCSLTVPTLPSLSVKINTCVHALWELCGQPARSFLTSLFFNVGLLWKGPRLPRKNTTFVYHMFAYKTAKQLCVLLSVGLWSLVYFLVFASCLWLPLTMANRSSPTALWWRSPSFSRRGFQSSLRRNTGTGLQQLGDDPFVCAA